MPPLKNSLLRSRIAPTPSGFLHIGNAYSFILTSQLVRQQQGTLLLRIDDMDGGRVRPEYLQDIFDTLDFLGVKYEEGPENVDDFNQHYSQKLRLPLYQKLLDKLCATGLVYACSCSRKTLLVSNNICICKTKKLPLETLDAAWRIEVPANTIIQFNDEYLGAVSIDLSELMPDFVIRKKDGMPAYQVSSLADDSHHHINYIVRGEDLLHSTAAQLYLAKLAGVESFTHTQFYHHALVKNSNGEKLSKSAGATSIKALRENGATLNEVMNTIENCQHSKLVKPSF